MISIEENSDTIEKKNCSETFPHVRSILNVLKYGITTLALILERSENFYERLIGKSLLDTI